MSASATVWWKSERRREGKRNLICAARFLGVCFGKEKNQKTQDLTESTLNSVAIQKEVQTEKKLKQEDKRLKVCLKSNMENKSDIKEKGKKRKIKAIQGG